MDKDHFPRSSQEEDDEPDSLTTETNPFTSKQPNILKGLIPEKAFLDTKETTKGDEEAGPTQLKKKKRFADSLQNIFPKIVTRQNPEIPVKPEKTSYSVEQPSVAEAVDFLPPDEVLVVEHDARSDKGLTDTEKIDDEVAAQQPENFPSEELASKIELFQPEVPPPFMYKTEVEPSVPSKLREEKPAQQAVETPLDPPVDRETEQYSIPQPEKQSPNSRYEKTPEAKPILEETVWYEARKDSRQTRDKAVIPPPNDYAPASASNLGDLPYEQATHESSPQPGSPPTQPTSSPKAYVQSIKYGIVTALIIIALGILVYTLR